MVWGCSIDRLLFCKVLLCITYNSIKHQSSIYAQLNIKTFQIQTNKVSLSSQFSFNSIKHQSFIYKQLNVKTVLFQTIQFSLSRQFCSIWPVDRTKSVATSPGLCRPGSEGKNGVIRVPRTSSITGASPSDYLVLYPWHSMGEFYPFCRDAVGVFYSPNWLGFRYS